MAKELRIGWDTQIPSSYDVYSDVQRTLLGGGQARTAGPVDPSRLVDSDRTLPGTGSLKRAPSKGETKIPDDLTKFWQK